MKLSLRDSLEARKEIDLDQQKAISSLYDSVYKDLKKQIKKLPKDGTTSQRIQKVYLDKLAKQLKEAYEEISTKMENQIKGDMERSAQSVVSDLNKWASKVGLSIEGAFSQVPKDIVSMLATGKVYPKGWTLSKAIWGDSQQKARDIDTILAKGVAANKSAYEIAKDLETYVNPSAKKDWNWSKVYPGTSKKIDYNAQRLARTMVSHAYQQSLVATTKPNPFVEGIKWINGHTSKTCELCKSRARENKYGLGRGVFPKDKLPADHPNGICSFAAVVPDSMDKVADRLADWVEGKSDPAIDKWFKAMYPSSNLDSLKEGVGQKADHGRASTPTLDFEEAYSNLVKDLSRSQMRNSLLKSGVDFDEVASMSLDQLESNMVKLLVKQRNEALSLMVDLQASYKNLTIDDLDKIKEIFRSDIPTSLNYQSTFQKFVYSTGKGNGKPSVVDKLPDGSIPLFRGVKDSTLPGSFINDLTRYDDMSYMGNGIFGDGIYMTTSEGAAKTYGGSIMKAAISPDAKVVDYDEVYREMMDDGFGSKVGAGDVSTYALLKGYDVIYQKVDRFEKGEIYYNVINRGVLIIERE